MSGNNLAVSITADVVDLQVKFALARAEANKLSAEMNKLAKAAAMGEIDAAGSARLQKLSVDLVDVRSEAANAAAAIRKAGLSTGEMAGQLSAGHGSISTATREFRALFDELSSGRTRQTPGTLAIIAQRVLGLGPAALGAVAGVGALAGGLAFLTYRAAEAAKGIGEVEIAAKFAGNTDLSKQAIKGMIDELARAPNISASAAKSIVQSFASMHDSTEPRMRSLEAMVSSYATLTGQAADKAGEELAKIFGSDEAATKLAKSLGGLTQQQIDAAKAADLSGNTNVLYAAKSAILQSVLSRATGALAEQNAGMTASFSNSMALVGAIQAGIPLQQVRIGLLDEQKKAQDQLTASAKKYGDEVRNTPQTQNQVLTTGVASAEKENPVAQQITEAKSKISEMTAALTVAQQQGDRVNVDLLTASLVKARENLTALRFGPVVDRMRDAMAQLAATWDGTQSGMLARQRAIAAASLGQTQAGSKEYLEVQREMAQLEVKLRQTAGQEIIANARMQISEINAATSTGALDRLSKDRDVWVQTLSSDRLTAAQRVEVARDLNQSIAALNKERESLASAITRADANTDIAIARMKIEAEKSALDMAVQANQMAAAHKLQILKDLTNQEYLLDLQRLQNELDTLKDQPVEYDRVYNQIRELKAKLNLDLAALDKQAAAEAARQAKDQANGWKSALGEIENAESQMVSNLLSGRKSMGQTLLSLSGELVTKEIANDLRAMTARLLITKTGQTEEDALKLGGFLYHLMNSQKEVAATVAAEAAKAKAADAGAAEKATADSAATAATQAEVSVSGPAQVMSDAAVAAAGAFAATAAIPFIGPELAPAAAADAFMAVSAFAPLASFDVGAWNLPRDMVAQVHKGETIMPANFAAGFRDAVSGGGSDSGKGGGDTNHYHLGVNALDGRSVERLLSSQSHTIAKALQKQVSRNWRPKV
jgi:hypothetical protein